MMVKQEILFDLLLLLLRLTTCDKRDAVGLGW
jgi:hypothetical protein